MIRLISSWCRSSGVTTSSPCRAIRSVKNVRVMAKRVPISASTSTLSALASSATTSARCSNGMSMAASTCSATRWNVVVHSIRKSAPARSTDCAAAARISATPSQSSASWSAVISANSTDAITVFAEWRPPSRASTPRLSRS